MLVLLEATAAELWELCVVFQAAWFCFLFFKDQILHCLTSLQSDDSHHLCY